MKEIPLTQGKVALVDDEDYEMLMKYKWYASRDEHRFYVRTNIGNPQKTIRMHNIILSTLKGFEIDHINGDPCDNRKINLRYVTHRQNCQNPHCSKRNKTSKNIGVHWCNYYHRWVSRIQLLGKMRYIGRFKNEIDAACAYQVTCRYLFG